MRIALLLLAGWSGSCVVAAGLFVALIRGGGGGTAASDVHVVRAGSARPRVHVPGPRAAVEAAPDLVAERR